MPSTPPVTLLSSDQANTSTLTKTLQRFHDHQNHRQPNNEYGTRRIRHNRRTKAKATSKNTMIPFRPSLGLQNPFDEIVAVKTVALYQFPRPADYRKQPGIEHHLALEVEGMTPQRGPLFIRTIRNQPPVTQNLSQLLSLAPVISVSGVLLTNLYHHLLSLVPERCTITNQKRLATLSAMERFGGIPSFPYYTRSPLHQYIGS